METNNNTNDNVAICPDYRHKTYLQYGECPGSDYMSMNPFMNKYEVAVAAVIVITAAT